MAKNATRKKLQRAVVKRQDFIDQLSTNGMPQWSSISSKSRGTAESTGPGKNPPPEDPGVPRPPMRRPHPSDERWGGQPHGFFDPMGPLHPPWGTLDPDQPRFPGGTGYWGWGWLRHKEIREWQRLRNKHN